jgi:hypothetical protein
MLKSLLVLSAMALLIVACSDDTASSELFSALPNSSPQLSSELPDEVAASSYDLLYNPQGLSPTEYIIAHNIVIEISQWILDNKPDFNPDTVFAWHYKISDERIEGGTLRRWVIMDDGTEYGGTYDFSGLQGDNIRIYADGSYGLSTTYSSQ